MSVKDILQEYKCQDETEMKRIQGIIDDILPEYFRKELIPIYSTYIQAYFNGELNEVGMKRYLSIEKDTIGFCMICDIVLPLSIVVDHYMSRTDSDEALSIYEEMVEDFHLSISPIEAYDLLLDINETLYLQFLDNSIALEICFLQRDRDGFIEELKKSKKGVKAFLKVLGLKKMLKDLNAISKEVFDDPDVDENEVNELLENYILPKLKLLPFYSSIENESLINLSSELFSVNMTICSVILIQHNPSLFKRLLGYIYSKSYLSEFYLPILYDLFYRDGGDLDHLEYLSNEYGPESEEYKKECLYIDKWKNKQFHLQEIFTIDRLLNESDAKEDDTVLPLPSTTDDSTPSELLEIAEEKDDDSEETDCPEHFLPDDFFDKGPIKNSEGCIGEIKQEVVNKGVGTLENLINFLAKEGHISPDTDTRVAVAFRLTGYGTRPNNLPPKIEWKGRGNVITCITKAFVRKECKKHWKYFNSLDNHYGGQYYLNHDIDDDRNIYNKMIELYNADILDESDKIKE